MRNRLELHQERERGLLAVIESAQDLSSRLDLRELLSAIVSRARNLLGSDVAWLSIDERDNDPQTFVTYTAAAVARLNLTNGDHVDESVPGRRAVAANAMVSVAAAMSAADKPVALVMDHVDLLHNRECLDAVTELALHLPAGSQLALASRAEPPVPLARLRASRDLMEIGADDLAMD